jgi:hypothetical protein
MGQGKSAKSRQSWDCPKCTHSNGGLALRCGECGYVRKAEWEMASERRLYGTLRRAAR